MKHVYRHLFRTPGALRFVLAGLLARIALPMAGIGLITLLAQKKGDYALAGAIVACFALSNAMLAPLVSRLTDRLGQSRVLPWATAISSLGMLGLLLSISQEGPLWSWFFCTVALACLPNISSMTRARWTLLYKNTPQLPAAYALESVLDEFSFIVGPPLSVFLSVSLFAEAGPLLASLALLAGVSLLVLQKDTEPPPNTRNAKPAAPVLSLPEIRHLLLIMLGMGMIVGCIDVLSVAAAKERHAPGAASLILSAYAISSCCAGLYFGSRPWRTNRPRLLLYCTLWTALSTLPLLLATTLYSLGAAVFIIGLAFAPSVILAMSLAEQWVRSEQLTEGMTWLITGLSLGVAIGAAGSGWLAQNISIQNGFWLAVCGAVICVIFSLQVQQKPPNRP